MTLYQAALAFHRNGDASRRDRVWKQLEDARKPAGGIQDGDKFLTLKEVRAELDRPIAKPTADWPMFGGDAARVGQSAGGPLNLEPLVTRELVSTDRDAKRWTELALKESVRYLADQRGQPIIPAFSPIAVGDKVVYRAYDGVYTINSKAYKGTGGRECPPGSTLWQHHTDGGLSGAGILADDKRGYLEQWKAHYQQYGPQSILFENSMLAASAQTASVSS